VYDSNLKSVVVIIVEHVITGLSDDTSAVLISYIFHAVCMCENIFISK